VRSKAQGNCLKIQENASFSRSTGAAENAGVGYREWGL
jgi:hypothetical protein